MINLQGVYLRCLLRIETSRWRRFCSRYLQRSQNNLVQSLIIYFNWLFLTINWIINEKWLLGMLFIFFFLLRYPVLPTSQWHYRFFTLTLRFWTGNTKFYLICKIFLQTLCLRLQSSLYFWILRSRLELFTNKRMIRSLKSPFLNYNVFIKHLHKSFFTAL